MTPEESWAQRQTFDAALPEKMETPRHLQQLVGRRDDANDLFALGPHADMVGRAVEDFPQGEVPDVQVELAGDVRSCCLAGRLVGGKVASGPADVAIAINGRIAAVTQTYQFTDFMNLWTAILPPQAVSRAENDVAVYLIGREGGRPVLLPLPRKR